MRPGLIIAGMFLAALPAWTQVKPVPLQRSVSSSKQFVIYFSDGAVRARLARRAEDLKREWLRSLQVKDEWKAPIVIQVVPTRPPKAPRLMTNVYESDGGAMKVQIDIYDPAVMRGTELDLEICRALSLEYMYRAEPPKAGKALTQPPPWLLEGLSEDALTRDEGLPAGLFEMVVKSGPPPKLEAFLKLRPERMDATSRAVYRAQAMGLLRALLSVPGGADSLSSYLQGLPGSNAVDARTLLEKFPQFASDPAGLSKIWTLTLANASAADRVKPLSMAETREQIATLLEIAAPKNPKKPEEGLIQGPEALQAIARSPSGEYTLKRISEDLFHLEMRAHPIMRPVVEEYRTIAMQLADKPKKNLEKRIRKNMELQAAVAGRTGEIEDYLNWFEATQLTTPSREFDVLPPGLNATDLPERTDAISQLLNGYEGKGW